ncbi:MAG: TIGR03619 family F420-dependent LLM class oxidoreductase [Chloroflexi bacterium]|nr:TIGR03619 family F420-dependent LLM class oxidoreductase [Chloroflexota bacterium]
MALIKFGVGLGTGPGGVLDARTTVAFFDKIEQWHFDSLWLSEHVVGAAPVLDCLTTITMFAARTRRAKIGTSVLLPTLRHPVLLAKQLATLDYLSEGRLLLALGIGSDPGDYAACEVPTEQRGRRLDEAMQLLRLLWTQDHVSFHGHSYRVEDVTLDPKPARRGGPPMWIGGRSEAALRRTARLSDGWLASFVTPAEFQSDVDKIMAYAAAAGRAFERDETGAILITCVAERGSRAYERAASYLEATRKRPAADVLERSLVGPAAWCVERLHEYIAAGLDKFVLRPLCPPEELIDQLALLREQVVPHFPVPVPA